MSMKKESVNKLFVLSIFAMIILSFSVSVVEAKTFSQVLSETFGEVSFSADSDMQLLISRILLILLVILLVYSASDWIPGIGENMLIRTGVSIIIGILSFMFVTNENIKYILLNYEALGVMITTIIPFIILMVFCFNLRMNPKTAVASIIVNKVLMIGFVLYLGFKWFTLTFVTDYGVSGNPPELAWVYPITLVATIVWLFFEGTLVKFFRREEGKEIEDVAVDRMKRSVAYVKSTAGALDELGGKKKSI
ncbi:MAG: hypothetical protein Q7S33_02705 [Nanoarchaeota archaeon]|nr:hypothetical protein [Nanoarchaeota archaeon]